MTFKELLGKQMLFFDGATGTQLQARGLQPGEPPESWNFTHPDIVEAVHRSYLDVGSNIVKSNTFGAKRLAQSSTAKSCFCSSSRQSPIFLLALLIAVISAWESVFLSVFLLL